MEFLGMEKCKYAQKRQFFFENIDNMDFSQLVEKAIKPSLFKKVQTFIINYGWAIKNKLNRILKNKVIGFTYKVICAIIIVFTKLKKKYY